MAVPEILSNIYSSLEEKYYALLDFFDEKGIPVYAYNDFLEDKGIPAFPFTIAIICLIVFLAFGSMFLSQGISQPLIFDIKDNTGKSLVDVKLTLLDAQGRVIKELGEFSDNGETTLKGMIAGEALSIKAFKSGYEVDSYGFTAKGKEPIRIFLELKSLQKYALTARIKLVDAVSGQAIAREGLTATASFGLGEQKQIRTGKIDEEGIVSFDGIPANEDVIVKISSNNYEEFTDVMALDSENIQSITLAPKASLEGIESKLTLFIRDDETGEDLKQVNIEIIQSDGVTHTKTVADSGFSVNVFNGTAIKFIIKKEGYIAFESLDFETIREDTERFIDLKKGGTSIIITVLDLASIPITGAEVQLFNEASQLVGSQITGFDGRVEFTDLNNELIHHLTAYFKGFLPKRETVDLKVVDRITLKLEAQTTANTGNTALTVFDNKEQTAANAQLQFYERINGELLPLGLPKQETDVEGMWIGAIELGKTVHVRAMKGALEGEAEFEVVAGLNEVRIEMHVSGQAKTIKFKDLAGNPVNGPVLIKSSSGDVILFEGETEQGEIFFNARENNYVKVTFTDADGNSHTEELYVEGLREIEFVVGKGRPPGLAPDIEFLGLTDIAGKEVDGIERGKEYYLNFQLTFPSGEYEAGLHVRLGSDDVKFVESQFVGITGFLGEATDFFYGRTYNAFPAPGNEGIDFSNKGTPGELNKWLELYFKNPKGIKKIKVRIKGLESMEQDFFEVHYRSWAKTLNAWSRNPEDEVLGFEEFNESRTALYASTYLEEIMVFEGRNDCQETICASYRFVTQTRGDYAVEDFKAVKDEVTALEVELIATEAATPKITFSTSRDPIDVSLTGFEVRNFREFIDSEVMQTDLEVTGITLSKNESVKLRLYFKGLHEASSWIKSQVVAGPDVLKETFYFSIYEEKEMTVSITPTTILVGENFTFNLSSEGLGIENATIQIMLPEGRVIKSIIGDGRANTGLNGKYYFENNLDPGTYKVRITAPNYKFFDTTITVGKAGIIKLPENIIIDLTVAEPKSQINVLIENSSEELIENIGFELLKEETFSPDFTVSVSGPDKLAPKGQEALIITAEFTGKEEERAATDLKLAVTGNLVGKYHTKTESRLNLTYNKELDSSCLEFSKKRLSVALLTDYLKTVNSYGLRFSDFDVGAIKQVEFKAKNNCPQPIILSPLFQGNQYIELKTEDIELGVGEETPVVIEVRNKVPMPGLNRKVYHFDLRFKAPQLQKVIPLDVILWSSRFALFAPNNIEVAIAQRIAGEKVIEGREIFIQNIGEADIQSLEVSVEPGSKEGISFEIFPKEPFPALQRGQSVYPPKILEIKSDKFKSQDIAAQIHINGTIEGKRMLLRTVNVVVHASAPACLKVTPKRFSFYSSSFTGVEGKELSITNYCSEEARISTLSVPPLGENRLTLRPLETEIIPIGSTAKFMLDLTRGGPLPKFEGSFFINALLIRSNTRIQSEPISLHIEISEKVAREGVATGKVLIPSCQDETEKLSIAFPKLSKDCSNGYCDAEQFSEFLAKKIEQTVKAAQSQVNKFAKEAANVPGVGNYRTFDALGVISDPFGFYLMNDNVSPDLMEYTIKKEKFYSLQRFMVEYRDKGSYEALRGTTYGNRIFLDNTKPFTGCGYYMARVTGSVPVFHGKLMDEQMLVFIEVTQPRVKTDECREDKIENIINFLPLDKSLKRGSEIFTWLGTVYSPDEKLRVFGESFAKELFKSKERFYLYEQGNSVLLELGEVPQGRLVQIEFAAIEAPVGPKRIKATVDRIITEAGLKQEDVVREAAQAIKTLKEMTLENGCIDKFGKYMLLSSVTKRLEVFSFEPKELQLKVFKDKSSCLPFKIKSNIKQGIKLGVPEKDQNSLKARGIIEIKIMDKEGKTEILPTQNIPLLDTDLEGENYVKEFQVCVKGDSRADLANNKKFEIILSGKLIVQDQKMIVTLKTCQINPYHAIKKMIAEKIPEDQESIERYAALSWAGADEKASLEKIRQALVENKDVPEGIVLASTETHTGPIKIDPHSKAVTEQLKSKNLTGIKYYFGACAVTAGACGFISKAGPLGAAFDVLVDCGLPAAWAASKYHPTTDSLRTWLKENVGGFFTSIWEFFAGKEAPEQTAGQHTQAVIETQGQEGVNLFYTGLKTSAVGSLAQPYFNLKMNDYRARVISDKIAGKLVSDLRATEKLKALPKDITDDMRSVFKEKLEASFKELKGQKISGDLVNEVTKKTATPAALDDVWQKVLLKEEHVNAFKGLDAAKEALEKVQKREAQQFIKNLAGQVPVSEIDLGTGEKRQFSTLIREETESLSKKVYNQLPESVREAAEKAGKTPELMDELKGGMKKAFTFKPETKTIPITKGPRAGEQIITKIYSVKVSPEKLRETITDTLTDVDNAFRYIPEGETAEVTGGLIRKNMGKEIMKQVDQKAFKEFAEEAMEKTGKKSITEKLAKKLAKKKGFRGFLWGAAKGMMCGAAANAAGLVAWNTYWKDVGPHYDKTVLLKSEETKPETKEVVDVEIERGKIYKIVKKRLKNSGKDSYEITLLPVEKVPSGAKWFEDCTGQSVKKDYLNRTVKESLEKAGIAVR